MRHPCPIWGGRAAVLRRGAREKRTWGRGPRAVQTGSYSEESGEEFLKGLMGDE